MARFIIFLTLLVLVGFVYIAFRTPPTSVMPRIDRASVTTSVEPFRPPRTGDRIRIELNTGASREGIIRALDADSVMIETLHGEVTYPRRNIAPSSRKLLFQADFEGVPLDQRPFTILDEELVRLLSDDDIPPDELGMGRNAQYVISGTNAIVIYGSHR